MPKSKAIEEVLDEVSFSITGKPRSPGMCPTCGEPVTGFRDELSKKEFEISGMCQGCQSSIFDEHDEEDY